VSSARGGVRDVGVVIQESEDTRALVDALRESNSECDVSHIPGLVRITSPGRMVIERAGVEAQLGREWETHEFQVAIVSYFGHIKDWDDDRIVIEWDH